MLEVRNAAYRYQSGREVFSDVSFTVEKGTIVSILGPNGAGKSTLLTCVAGLFELTHGDILLHGTPMGKMKREDIAKMVGFVPQNHYPTFDYTVEEFVLLGRSPHIGMLSSPSERDRQITEEALRTMELESFADRVYTQLSGGERQLVLIARALAQQPEILLLDEPTAHLDYGNTYRTLRMVKDMAERGFAVVITTHDPNQALLLGGRAGVIDRKGRMTSGPVGEIVTEERLSQIYDCALKLVDIEEIDRLVCVTPDL